MGFVKSLLKRFFKTLISAYVPALLVVIFAVVFFRFFPEGPVWPVGVFVIFIIYVFARYVK
ncbi:hypothetical protein FYL58_15670 [Klebsiella aerogenes]|nr:hypothetical protein [Klebsiella aerogenes]EIW9498987.1 hypothetical protein [Klebsiella aerogenes]OWP38239.1 hypothetical protein CEG88_23705 [Klebsiella aerogenes]